MSTEPTSAVNLLIAGPLPACHCGQPSVYLAWMGSGKSQWLCEKHKDQYFTELDGDEG